MVRKLVVVLSAFAALAVVSAPAASAATSHGASPAACIGRYPICGGGWGN